MTMPGFAPEPLKVTCLTCGAEGWTYDFQHAGRAVDCGCCPQAHDHDDAANACPRTHEDPCGPGVAGCTVCRPVAVRGVAYLRVAGLDELMDGADSGPVPAESTEMTEA